MPVDRGEEGAAQIRFGALGDPLLERHLRLLEPAEHEQGAGAIVEHDRWSERISLTNGVEQAQRLFGATKAEQRPAERGECGGERRVDRERPLGHRQGQLEFPPP